MLKLVGMVRNAYWPYLAVLNTFLFLACRRILKVEGANRGRVNYYFLASSQLATNLG